MYFATTTTITTKRKDVLQNVIKAQVFVFNTGLKKSQIVDIING